MPTRKATCGKWSALSMQKSVDYSTCLKKVCGNLTFGGNQKCRTECGHSVPMGTFSAKLRYLSKWPSSTCKEKTVSITLTDRWKIYSGKRGSEWHAVLNTSVDRLHDDRYIWSYHYQTKIREGCRHSLTHTHSTLICSLKWAPLQRIISLVNGSIKRGRQNETVAAPGTVPHGADS